MSPRSVPGDAAALPHAIRALANRLPLVEGRLGPIERILRAARMGEDDRAVANGNAPFQRASTELSVSTRVYVVLADQNGEGTWVCYCRRDCEGAVGDPPSPGTVLRGLASEAEAIAYLWGSGAEPVLPPAWPGPG